jgi:hypothetical protein
MAMVSVRETGVHEDVAIFGEPAPRSAIDDTDASGELAITNAESQPPAPELARPELTRIERAIRVSRMGADGLFWIALFTLPMVIAFHIEVGGELKLDFDLGSTMWLSLLPAAGFCRLNALRLSRARLSGKS